MSADITKPETWYGLKLGDVVTCGPNRAPVGIERVPGGWLYWFNGKGTFIPFSDEFNVCEVAQIAGSNQYSTGCGKVLSEQELRLSMDTLCIPTVCRHCGKKTKLVKTAAV